jgi:hypothetical protein
MFGVPLSGIGISSRALKARKLVWSLSLIMARRQGKAFPLASFILSTCTGLVNVCSSG